jgi:hypothetical protein
LLNEKWVNGENIYRIVGRKRFMVGMMDYALTAGGVAGMAVDGNGIGKSLGVTSFNTKE